MEYSHDSERLFLYPKKMLGQNIQIILKKIVYINNIDTDMLVCYYVITTKC